MRRILLLALVLAGCATERDWKWEKAASSQEDWYRDRGACRAQAYAVPDSTRPQVVAVFESCLESKGWHRAQP